jgi:hypothetical protein
MDQPALTAIPFWGAFPGWGSSPEVLLRTRLLGVGATVAAIARCEHLQASMRALSPSRSPGQLRPRNAREILNRGAGRMGIGIRRRDAFQMPRALMDMDCWGEMRASFGVDLRETIYPWE